MTTLLAICYLLCFQFCAAPAIVRIVRRKSSADLSIWREVLLVVGASTQLMVMLQTGADWRVIVSPLATIINVAVLVVVIRRYREGG